MTPIEVAEHGKSEPIRLEAAAVDALEGSKLVQVTREPGRPGYWRLKARSKVGAATITVPGGQPVTVHITPKLPIHRMFFLLGYAQHPIHWPDEDVGVSEADDLVLVTARLYARQLEKALQQGLLQGYRTLSEASLLVRGRIREAEQIRRHHGLPLPVETVHDEFTVDIAENQILRTACERLLRLPEPLPDDARDRLLRLRLRLADVTPLDHRDAIPPWRPNRLNARYQPALRLAELVLRGRSVEHWPGGVTVNGFYFDMFQIFEDFVTIALGKAFAGTGTTKLQGEGGVYLDAAHTIRMKPDLVLYADDGTVLAVADAKYKAEKPGGYPDDDLYQMLAYCAALGLPSGHLVYAKGFAPRKAHQLPLVGITLHQHALDLNQPPAGLLAEIRALAAQMTT